MHMGINGCPIQIAMWITYNLPNDGGNASVYVLVLLCDK